MFFLHILCYFLLVRSFLSGFASIVQQATDQPIGVCSKVGVQQEACGISSFLKVRWAGAGYEWNPTQLYGDYFISYKDPYLISQDSMECHGGGLNAAQMNRNPKKKHQQNERSKWFQQKYV